MSVDESNSEQIAIVIPAYNEELTIREVIRSVLSHAKVILVDDGSSDNTAVIAQNEGCEVVIHPHNRGYDQALASGMHRALDLGFEIAITMDADGQHNPETILKIVSEFSKGAELVIGIRKKKQRIAESFFAWISMNLWGIKDPLCGMKGYRLYLLRMAGRFDTYGSIGTELTIRVAKSGKAIHQVPVETYQRIGTPRFGSGLLPNLKILRALCYALFSKPIK